MPNCPPACRRPAVPAPRQAPHSGRVQPMKDGMWPLCVSRGPSFKTRCKFCLSLLRADTRGRPKVGGEGGVIRPPQNRQSHRPEGRELGAGPFTSWQHHGYRGELCCSQGAHPSGEAHSGELGRLLWRDSDGGERSRTHTPPLTSWDDVHEVLTLSLLLVSRITPCRPQKASGPVRSTGALQTTAWKPRSGKQRRRIV